MHIIITVSEYIRAAGCNKATAYRRIHSGALGTATRDNSIVYIIYGSDYYVFDERVYPSVRQLSERKISYKTFLDHDELQVLQIVAPITNKSTRKKVRQEMRQLITESATDTRQETRQFNSIVNDNVNDSYVALMYSENKKVRQELQLTCDNSEQNTRQETRQDQKIRDNSTQNTRQETRQYASCVKECDIVDNGYILSRENENTRQETRPPYEKSATEHYKIRDNGANSFIQDDLRINDSMIRLFGTPMTLSESDRSGSVNVYRKLLDNPIMDNFMEFTIFMELLLLTNMSGSVYLTGSTRIMRMIGVDQYVSAISSLEKRYEIIKTTVDDIGVKIEFTKWKKYQKKAVGEFVLKDLSVDDGHVDAASSPTPPSCDIEYNISNTSITCSILEENKDIQKENTKEKVETEPEKKKPRPRKKSQITRNADNDKDYDPTYRKNLPDAKEVYEYYRDNMGVASVRMRALDLLIVILDAYNKEDLIKCIDNYSQYCVSRNTEKRYIRSAQSFFNDSFFTSYLPGELPKPNQKKNTNNSPSTGEKKNVEMIKFTMTGTDKGGSK